MEKRETKVVAALIRRDDKFLICKRPQGKMCPLLWEFAGGKVESGESDEQALARECREELDIGVSVGSKACEVTFAYPEKTVHIAFYHAEITGGEPRAIEHPEITWASRADLVDYKFCPADADVVKQIAARRI